MCDSWFGGLLHLTYSFFFLIVSPSSGSWMCWCAMVWGSTVAWRPWPGCQWNRISGRASGTFLHTSMTLWKTFLCKHFMLGFCICLYLMISLSVLGRGKIKRIAFQFTPYSWVKFEWKPASNLRRWLAVLGIIFMVRNANMKGKHLSHCRKWWHHHAITMHRKRNVFRLWYIDNTCSWTGLTTILINILLIYLYLDLWLLINWIE